MFTIISSVISISILLNIYSGKINMNDDINIDYDSKKDIKKELINTNNDIKKELINTNNDMDVPKKERTNPYKDKYIFLSAPFHCPKKYNDNFNQLFSNIQDQLPGYTPNDYLDLIRYNNNKYVVPQPINI